MLCGLIGQRYVWSFYAPDAVRGRKIANIILLSEGWGWCGKRLAGFDPAFGVWEAIGQEPEEVKELQLAEGGKFIEIKRKRRPNIDALYLTRLQKERMVPSETP